MTQRIIPRATSRVTECLFYIVVFVFLILFDSEQRLDDYILCQRAKEKPSILCYLHFPRSNALCHPARNDLVTYFWSHGRRK